MTEPEASRQDAAVGIGLHDERPPLLAGAHVAASASASVVAPGLPRNDPMATTLMTPDRTRASDNDFAGGGRRDRRRGVRRARAATRSSVPVVSLSVRTS